MLVYYKVTIQMVVSNEVGSFVTSRYKINDKNMSAFMKVLKN
jgi:hypothetical protein